MRGEFVAEAVDVVVFGFQPLGHLLARLEIELKQLAVRIRGERFLPIEEVVADLHHNSVYRRSGWSVKKLVMRLQCGVLPLAMPSR